MNSVDQDQVALYVDISEFLNSRITTGIQRVIREFLQRCIQDAYTVNIVRFNPAIKQFELLPNNEIILFLHNIKDYRFSNLEPFKLFEQKESYKFFFDIDSIWNSPLKREILYPQLKEHSFKICNFIYDLIPAMFPKYLYEETKQNFIPYLNAVYKYSDLVFFDSVSAKNDFFAMKQNLQISKEIRTKVVHLGSDFSCDTNIFDEKYRPLLSSRFILFVGTIEPRKGHQQVLESFDNLYRQYPELKLIFIGKIGWNVEDLMQKLNKHPLLNKNIFHFQNIEDETLSVFYKNAFIVTYLSKYEGYGLPVAESLSYGNITIVSKNSSLMEVGTKFVDYVEESIQNSLTNIISRYLTDEDLYIKKKNFIRQNYKPISWSSVYKTLHGTLLKEIKW